MTGLGVLWLPILLSAVVIFAASAAIHMVLPWHKNDYRKTPKEDEVLNALRPLAIPPGDYMIPRASNTQEMRSPEFIEKMKKGPVLILTLKANASTSMAKSLVLWFIYSVIVSVFAAYLAGHALPPGSGFRGVVRFTGAVAFIGYSAAIWPMWIWYGRSLSTTVKETVDGLVYALLTAAVFGWLWPH
ncbi:MAG: hypothetical protein ABR899_00050 [Candidatus Krumholzibacteriaceae bacterium]|jgi:hypothetical protein